MEQILKEMDPDVSKESIQKFMFNIKKILETLQIEDPLTDIVSTLAKIETRVNFLCEARNILSKQDEKKTAAMRGAQPSLRMFEIELDKKRREIRTKEQKEKMKKQE